MQGEACWNAKRPWKRIPAWLKPFPHLLDQKVGMCLGLVIHCDSLAENFRFLGNSKWLSAIRLYWGHPLPHSSLRRRHAEPLFRVVLQMVALHLDELIKPVSAQSDTFSRVLPSCPGQILHIPVSMLCDCRFQFLLTGLGKSQRFTKTVPASTCSHSS